MQRREPAWRIGVGMDNISVNGGELGRSVQIERGILCACKFMQLIFIKSVELDETEKEYSGCRLIAPCNTGTRQLVD